MLIRWHDVYNSCVVHLCCSGDMMCTISVWCIIMLLRWHDVYNFCVVHHYADQVTWCVQFLCGTSLCCSGDMMRTIPVWYIIMLIRWHDVYNFCVVHHYADQATWCVQNAVCGLSLCCSSDVMCTNCCVWYITVRLLSLPKLGNSNHCNYWAGNQPWMHVKCRWNSIDWHIWHTVAALQLVAVNDLCGKGALPVLDLASVSFASHQLLN